MKTTRIAYLTTALLACVGAHAEEVAPRTGDTAPAARTAPEPQVIQQVTEDDQIRIEELRVRGQTKRLTVQPKIRGVGAYEIAPPEPGRAPADDPKAGQRVWLSINF
ncbi:hypothetical protein AACH06_11200 [Ideonella sp. DXS29W]|uniref:DUF2782 domain-containing protein n=1 Tax=Ideonella lacteola TaxID=2984193 RepID=A0ABU9BRW2_9BURK